MVFEIYKINQASMSLPAIIYYSPILANIILKCVDMGNTVFEGHFIALLQVYGCTICQYCKLDMLFGHICCYELNMYIV